MQLDRQTATSLNIPFNSLGFKLYKNSPLNAPQNSTKSMVKYPIEEFTDKYYLQGNTNLSDMQQEVHQLIQNAKKHGKQKAQKLAYENSGETLATPGRSSLKKSAKIDSHSVLVLPPLSLKCT